MDATLTLYTIGHSNLTAEAFLALLQQHHITTLVDVRSAPYSKYVPHFGKRELETYLKAHNVHYRYAGEILGGRPRDAEVYKNEALPDADTKREDFLKLVQYEEIMKREWYQKGIRHLLTIVRDEAQHGGRVAIMCSEGDPRECHRHHLITRSLLDPRLRVIQEEVQVMHLLKEGTLETVTPAEFDKPPQQQLSLWGD